jgi:1,4-alpha-glucan branching enzyme
VSSLLADLNSLYRHLPALHQLDHSPAGFEWVDASDSEQSVISLLRKGTSSGEVVLVVLNFTPITRYGYEVGVPREGQWEEVLNTDAKQYGGGGCGNAGGVLAEARPKHGRPFSLSLTLPPLGAVFLKWGGDDA